MTSPHSSNAKLYCPITAIVQFEWTSRPRNLLFTVIIDPSRVLTCWTRRGKHLNVEGRDMKFRGDTALNETRRCEASF